MVSGGLSIGGDKDGPDENLRQSLKKGMTSTAQHGFNDSTGGGHDFNNEHMSSVGNMTTERRPAF